MILDRTAIERLLPQRPPLLLVDRVTSTAAGAAPVTHLKNSHTPSLRSGVASLVAALDLTGDEAVFRGHFPGRPIWPGSYTIEGLAQACAVLGGLAGGLAAWDGAQMPAVAAPVAEVAAMVAAVKVKLLRPVVPPATLVYRVGHTHAVGDVHRFAVEASVDGVAVAQGTLDVVWRVGP